MVAARLPSIAQHCCDAPAARPDPRQAAPLLQPSITGVPPEGGVTGPYPKTLELTAGSSSPVVGNATHACEEGVWTAGGLAWLAPVQQLAAGCDLAVRAARSMCVCVLGEGTARQHLLPAPTQLLALSPTRGADVWQRHSILLHQDGYHPGRSRSSGGPLVRPLRWVGAPQGASLALASCDTPSFPWHLDEFACSMNPHIQLHHPRRKAIHHPVGPLPQATARASLTLQ